jgi:hypothetical protein
LAERLPTATGATLPTIVKTRQDRSGREFTVDGQPCWQCAGCGLVVRLYVGSLSAIPYFLRRREMRFCLHCGATMPRPLPILLADERVPVLPHEGFRGNS